MKESDLTWVDKTFGTARYQQFHRENKEGFHNKSREAIEELAASVGMEIDVEAFDELITEYQDRIHMGHIVAYGIILTEACKRKGIIRELETFNR